MVIFANLCQWEFIKPWLDRCKTDQRVPTAELQKWNRKTCLSDMLPKQNSVHIFSLFYGRYFSANIHEFDSVKHLSCRCIGKTVHEGKESSYPPPFQFMTYFIAMQKLTFSETQKWYVRILSTLIFYSEVWFFSESSKSSYLEYVHWVCRVCFVQANLIALGGEKTL